MLLFSQKAAFMIDHKDYLDDRPYDGLVGKPFSIGGLLRFERHLHERGKILGIERRAPYKPAVDIGLR